jgi:hypothetical protein
MSKEIIQADDKVWVTVSRTINLGNYENIKVEAGMSQTLLPTEDPQIVLGMVCEQVAQKIFQKSKLYKKELKRKKPKPSDNG